MNDVLDLSTGKSWVSETHYRQRVFNRRFDDGFKLGLMKKDMDIATRVAADAGVSMPVAAFTHALWQAVQAAAPPGASVSHLVRALEEREGVELKGKG
jgi:3-hydroxyisobutyrate dehydrogenase-like beta-hydroxyacid dehydrogenase